MSKKLLLPGLTLLLLLAIGLSCAHRDEPYLCSTCPEIDPAYAAAFAYIESHREQIGLRPEIDELEPHVSTRCYLGVTHVRCRQRYHGVRVMDTEIVINLDTELAAIGHWGQLIADVTIDHRPQLAGDTALTVAEQHFNSLGYDGTTEGNGELVVYRFEDTDYLCWTYILREDGGPNVIVYFIDANTAAIVRWASMIGTFD